MKDVEQEHGLIGCVGYAILMSSLFIGSVLIPYLSLLTDVLLNMGLCTQELSRIR